MSAFYRSSTPFRRQIPRKPNMNSRAKCTSCKSFFPQEEAVWSNGLQKVCSSQCLSEYMDRKRPSKHVIKAKRAAKRPVTATALPIALRQAVRARDGHACRWCGQRGQQVHHVLYRSQGGPDEMANLILLCVDCHTRAHSSKRAFQPLLLACLWIHYVEGTFMTIPNVERRLRRAGMLTELQEVRLAS